MSRARVTFVALLCLSWGWVPLLLLAEAQGGRDDRLYPLLGLLAAFMLIGVPAAIGIKSPDARGWHGAALGATVLMVWNAVSGLIGLFSGIWGAWSWLALLFIIAYASLGTACLLLLHKRLDEAGARARQAEQRELEYVRHAGGACPRCRGAGIIRPNALQRIVVTAAAAGASMRGLPVTSRRAVSELNAKCPLCNGVGWFTVPADSGLAEPSRA